MIFGLDLELSKEALKQVTMTGGIIAGAVIFRLLAGIIVRTVVRKFEDDSPEDDSDVEKRAFTIASIVNSAINVFLLVIAILTIMSEWGIDIGPLLAGAGILGLAIGFGAQELVKDVVTGFFILIENSFNVGDQVEIAGQTGKVLKMNLRTTILIDDEDNVYTISNASINAIKKLPNKR